VRQVLAHPYSSPACKLEYSGLCFAQLIFAILILISVANAIQQSEGYKLEGMLIEIDKVLKICFTFSVTSATAERLFSSLRRIKTYL